MARPDKGKPQAQPATAEPLTNDLGQLILPVVRYDRLTVQTIMDHMTFANQPEAMALLLDFGMGRHHTEANLAVLSALDAGDRVLIAVRHFVTERWGGWDLPTLGRVVGWLVAEHGLTQEQAKDLPLTALLPRLSSGQLRPSPALPQMVGDIANVFQLVSEVWHVVYADSDEAGDFQDRRDSSLRHLGARPRISAGLRF